jgi:hypothetical protein
MRTSASGLDAVSEDREPPAQREEANSDSDEDNIRHRSPLDRFRNERVNK